MDLQLTGKVAVITGSGRGIGYASALALAREGARIVITDIDPDSVRQAVAGLKEAGFEAIGTVLDVCDDGQVRAMADERAPTAASTSWSTTPASPATSTCSRCRKRTGTPWSTPS